MGTSGSTRLAIGYRVLEGAGPGPTRPIRQPTQDTIDAEIYAISQVIKWIKESGLSVKQYWIFIDSQMAIQKMQRNNAEMHEILQDLKSIKAEKKTVHIN